jgi:hypothetical protein
MSDAKFIPGLFFKDKHENAPDFVMCKGSIKVADLAEFLAAQTEEWVNFDLKRSRDGRPYASVDDWKPSGGGSGGSRGGAPQRERPAKATDDEPPFDDDDIPFISSAGRF